MDCNSPRGIPRIQAVGDLPRVGPVAFHINPLDYGVNLADSIGMSKTFKAKTTERCIIPANRKVELLAVSPHDYLIVTAETNDGRFVARKPMKLSGRMVFGGDDNFSE